jgi:trk system potassium uptake protein TrkH
MFRKVSIINWKMLVRVIGWLLMIEAAFMVIPLIVALIYGEESLKPFICSIAITFICGVIATFGVRPKRFDMGKREGFLLTASVWVVFSVFGTIPFMVSDLHLDFTTAFFEAMSGFTTTGASVLSENGLAPGMMMWRTLMQWIGGMGIILFTLAVLPMLNSSGGMQMFNAEVTGITHEKLRPRVSATAKRLWLIYFLLTVLLTGLYWLGPLDGLDSVCYAISTISTGGFTVNSEANIAYHSQYVKVVTTIFMFIGGVNFTLIYRASTGHFREIWHNEVFRFYIWVILAMFVLFDICIMHNAAADKSFNDLTIDSLYQIVATISTTGYTVEHFDQWGSFALGMVMLMIMVGACAGSTSGGAKLDRFLLLWKNGRNELYRCIYPNHIMPLEINKRAVSPEIANKVMVFLGLYIAVIIFGGTMLTLCGGDFYDSYFSAFSCVSNSGIDASVSHSGIDYATISGTGKWILCLLMLTGRLEIFTVLILFTPRFWHK